MKLLQIGRGFNVMEVEQGFDADWGCGGTMNLDDTTVSQLEKIVPPGFEADDIETTTHDNTDGFKTFMKGLTDAGEVEMEGNFDYTNNYATCYELMATRTLQSVTITLPTSPSVTQFTCNGFMKSLECEDPVDDKISFAGTLKISGKPVITQV